MDSIETWASKEAAKRGVTTPHSIKGFKDGVRASYEALIAARAQRKLSFVPGGDDENIWMEALKK